MPRIHLITDIAADPGTCFDVSLDVGVHLAGSPSERIVGGVRQGRMKLGEHVTWSARHFGIRWRMTSKIVAYERPRTFTDGMQRGPFGRWRHQHTFEQTAYGTRMIDDVDFASPFGALGRLVDAMVLERYMTGLLHQHNDHVRAVAECAGGEPSESRYGRSRAAARYRGTPVHVGGKGTTIIRVAPSAVLEFVLGVERYRRADRKIGRVRFARREGNIGQVRHGGRFLGVAAPAATLAFELSPWSRLATRRPRSGV